MSTQISVRIQGCLDRLQNGEAEAGGDLIRLASDRLFLLTRQMLRKYERVHRWEQTDDVCQSAMLRLCRALEHVVPATALEFFKLASTQIRRELIDLARHHYGPQGAGAHHASAGPGDSTVPGADVRAEADEDPRRLASWTEFHTQASLLPEEERTLFDLIWYQGMTQEEAAGVLGVSVRTVKSRWRSARLLLHDRLGGQLPGE